MGGNALKRMWVPEWRGSPSTQSSIRYEVMKIHISRGEMQAMHTLGHHMRLAAIRGTRSACTRHKPAFENFGKPLLQLCG